MSRMPFHARNKRAVSVSSIMVPLSLVLHLNAGARSDWHDGRATVDAIVPCRFVLPLLLPFFRLPPNTASAALPHQAASSIINASA